MGLASLILALTPGGAAGRTAAADIRALRAQSNAAIAAHDLAGMRAPLAPGYHVLPGSSGVPADLASFDARIAATFADPDFVTYLRTPGRVTVARSGRRAAEIGRWVGSWRKPDGEMRVSGTYLATWVPTPAGWRLLNEVFVTLDCSGSAACADAG